MQSLSPRSRRAKLTGDINKIDEELQSLSQDMGSFSSQVYYDPEVKLLQVENEKQELQQKIKKISISTNCKESLLRTQLAEIQTQIQCLRATKQSEHSKIQENKERCMEDVCRLKESLSRLEQDYAVISKSKKRRDKFQNESAQAKLKSYQDTVADLETRIDEISGKRLINQQKNERINENIEQLKCRISMAKEELFQIYYMRGEFVAENEQAEEALEVLKESFLENLNNEQLQDYFESCKKIKSEQEEILKTIKDSQINIEEIRKDLQKAEKNFKTSDENLEKFLAEMLTPKSEQEIEDFEGLLRETCENAEINSLEDVVLALNTFEYFDLDEEILKIQLQKVEAKEKTLKDEWQLEQKSFQEAIKIIAEDKDHKERLEKEYMQKFRSFYNNEAGITQWKNEVNSALSKTKPYSGPVKDTSVLSEFRTRCISTIENPQTQKSLLNILITYTEKLSHREKLLQDNHKKVLKLQISKEISSKHQTDLKTVLSSLEKTKFINRLKLSKLILKEKSQILLSSPQSPHFLQQYQHLLKLSTLYSATIENYTDRIEFLLKPTIQSSTQSLNILFYESQQLKLLSKDLSEEENTLTLQLEKILEKQHRFMLSSLNDNSPEPDLTQITFEIETVATQLSLATKKVSQLDNEFYTTTAKLEEEENILSMKFRSIISALQVLTNEQKKLEDFETRLHKLEENEAAPIPESMNDRIRAKSMNKILIGENKIKVDSQETPEKLQSEDSMYSSKYFPKSFIERSPKPYKPRTEDPNPIEKALLDKLSPLLSGYELYKRFSQRSSLKQEEFDPLDYKKNTPEACGYGLRVFKLSKCFTRIDVKHQLRPGFDSSLPVESILKIIIPQSTSAILKVQKKLGKGEIDCTDRTFANGTYESMKERGFFDTKSKAFVERCSACKWFPFSIALVEGGRIEVIAKTYPVFKNWVNGINCLIKNKKILLKVKNRISVA